LIHLTAAAAAEIQRQRGAAETDGPVRLGVRPGGCAGTKYHLEVAAQRCADDTVIPCDGFDLVCSVADMAVLRGITVDFSADLVDGGFRYENPNAGSVCGCGDSFQPLVSLGILPVGN